MERPLFELKISEHDETGVEAIALVDHPATESHWHAFNEHKPTDSKVEYVFDAKKQFQTVDKDKQIIAGFAMIAGQKMFRRDPLGEYDVFFSAETIEQIVEKFFKNKNTDKSNIMHNSNMMLDDVFIISSFITDSKRGINTPTGFDEAPDGSWFVEMKVNDLKLWEQFIKTGEFKGFSVEGIFEQIEVEFKTIIMNKEQTDQLEEMKSGFDKFLGLFKKTEVKATEDKPEEEEKAEEKEEERFGEVILQNGDILTYDGELEVGTMVKIIAADGSGELAVSEERMDHETSDGTMVISTQGGLVTDIVKKEEEVVNNEVVEELAIVKADLEAATQKNTELETSNTKYKEDFGKESEDHDKTSQKLETAHKKIKEQQATITQLQSQEGSKPADKPASKPSWLTVQL